MRKEDRSEAIARLCSGLSANDARRILGPHFSFREALGLWVTAIRELFEEAGILLASREASGRRIIATLTEAQLAERHAALLNHSSSFRSLLESTKLLCDMAALDHFSHWQTPPELPMRFDTHFFLARLPEGQNPLATSPEVEHSLWLTPDHALQMFSRNELPIIFPTFASLRTLADFETLASVQKEFGAAQ